MTDIRNELQTQLNENSKVSFTNLFGWDISFNGCTQREREGILIPAYVQKYSQLPIREVLAQISIGNSAFVGKNGKGEHAQLLIEDAEIRNLLFDTDVEPVQLTAERISKMLKSTTKESFEKNMKCLIVTPSESREILHRWDDLQIDELPRWKGDVLELHCKDVIKGRISSDNASKKKVTYR